MKDAQALEQRDANLFTALDLGVSWAEHYEARHWSHNSTSIGKTAMLRKRN